MHGYIYTLALASVVCCINAQGPQDDLSKAAANTLLSLMGGGGGDHGGGGGMGDMFGGGDRDRDREGGGGGGGGGGMTVTRSEEFHFESTITATSGVDGTGAHGDDMGAGSSMSTGSGGPQVQPSAGTLDLNFTLADIDRMFAGMDAKKMYNYQGQEAKEGEQILTIDMLNTVRNRLLAQGTLDLNFTLADIDRMFAGMDAKKMYNYQGQEAKEGEQILTIDMLNTVRNRLLAQGTLDLNFTLADIDRMFAGMDAKKMYNYQGQEAKEGEQILTIDMLNTVRNRLLAQAGGDGVSVGTDDGRVPIDGLSGQAVGMADHGAGGGAGGDPRSAAAITPIGRFTRLQLVDMIAGTEQGLRFNYKGEATTSADATLTLEQLRRFLRDIEFAGTAAFTLTDLDTMIAGIRNGLAYNFQGRQAAEGEKVLTLERLNDLKRLLSIQVGRMPVSITFEDIERIRQGIESGLQYNAKNGEPAALGDTLLDMVTLDMWHTELLERGQPNPIPTPTPIPTPLPTPMPKPKPKHSSSPSLTYTYEQVTRMLSGIDQGKSYNYRGDEAQEGEAVLSRDNLNMLAMILKPRMPMPEPTVATTTPFPATTQSKIEGSEPATFSLSDIRRMLAGINQGFSYNYRGQLAKQGERTISREYLNKLLSNLNQDGPPPTFSLDQVRSMINGMQRGLKYDFLGNVDLNGEDTYTLKQLKLMESRLANQGSENAVRKHSFTKPEIRRMLLAMDDGQIFNYQGQQASTGEQTISRNELKRLLSDDGKNDAAPATFTLETIDSMIHGMERGLRYNIYGRLTTSQEDKILTLLELLNLKIRLLSKGDDDIRPLKYTLDDVHRMLRGSNDGLLYNYHGILARPGEPTLSKGLLQLLKLELENTEEIRLAQFSLKEINEMIAGMKRGLRYNLRGTLATDDETTLTIQHLYDLRLQFPTAGQMHSDPTRFTFTLEQVQRMLTGMSNGLRYNHQGEEAQHGEPTISLAQLQVLLKRLQSSDISHQFTMEQIQRMKDGINSGKQYNYKGQPASAGEQWITIEWLNDLERKLHAQGPMTPVQHTYSFTLGQLNEIIIGMDKGLRYNIRGKPAQPGERTLTMKELLDLQTNMQLKGNTSESKQTPSFTLEDLERMKHGMIEHGIQYNFNGQQASPGEQVITLDWLNNFLLELQTKGPMTTDKNKYTFTLDQINDMIVGMDNGLTFNYNGIQAQPGDQTFTRKELNDLQNNMQSAGNDSHTIQSPQFTLKDIERMRNGMINNEIQHNFNGQPASPGEQTITLDWLNDLQSKLQTQGPMTPITQTYSFTLDQINEMINGIDMGLTYNHHGKPAQPGEQVITKKELADLISKIQSQKNTSQTIQSPRFTLKDIERMRNGMMSNGIQYNFNGHPASQGEQVITLDWLNDFELKLHKQGPMTKSFTLDQINEMIKGIDKGLKYNYRGKPAQTGERAITKKELADLISNIQPKENTLQTIQSPQFTLNDLKRMRNDMINNGIQYNFNGQPALPGEQVITLDWLNDLEFKLQNQGPMTPVKHTYSFTPDQINEMINGIDKGLKYNYHGKPAQPGERVLTKKELADLISNIQPQENTSQTIQSPQFSLNDIERMRNDMINNGIQYNVNGQPASPGEQVVTLEWLNDFEFKLQNQGPMTPANHTYSFTPDQINEMIYGIDKGLKYNYHGKPAQPGERVITKKELADLISNIQPQGNTTQTIQSPQFSLNDIERMRNDMINNGIQYNFNGQPASPGEQVVTHEWLNDFEFKLQNQGPMTPVKHTYSFTPDQINEMMNGIDKGLKYNYHGKPAQPGERVITKKELVDLISNKQPQGNTTQTIQSPQFTLNDIERMRNNMINNGIQYNFNGQPASPGEQVVTLEWLNVFEFKLQNQGPMTPVKHTYSFTPDKINEMINGIDKGLKYNYHGKPAQPGERAITKKELADLISNKQPQENTSQTIQSPQFTLNDIERMRNDMINNGIQYNFNGHPALPGEQVITLDWLNDLEFKLQNQGPMNPVKHTFSFTLDQINEMIKGIDKGRKYNYHGKPAQPGERIITKKELGDLISNISPQGNTSQSIQSHRFTLEDIERMKHGMINNGIEYNFNGQPASPDEPVIPLDWLNDLQFKLKTMGPMTPAKHTYSFTPDQINEMINGIDKGLKYNYHGKPAQPGERAITKKELVDLISNIPPQGNTSQTIHSPRFTLNDIERMRNDIINNGIQYNFNGQPASPGEQVITLDWLNDLQLKLQTQGPMTPVKHTYTFTLDQIKDMINGIDKGLTYNYHGKPAQPRERVITKKELADLISNIPPQGNTSQSIQSPQFTLEDIERMKNGMINNGMQYNLNGQPASPGEPVIPLDWLNDSQLKLQTMGPTTPVNHTYTFTLDQINEMINGIDKGLKYNYHGKPAQPGERVITKKELADLISNIPPQGNTSQTIQSPRFTLKDIERMRNDIINNGIQYNFNGQPASPGEQVITLDWLNDLQLKLQTQGPMTPVKHTYTFTLDQIKDMINGIDKGLTYNYHGKPAQPGERVITKKELADLISNIPPQGNTSQSIQSPQFTLEDIEQMKNGMLNNGMQYNLNGQPASPGEPVIPLDWLNDSQLKLQTMGPTTPVNHTYTFTLDQINEMINGIDKGLKYNYHGKPAQPGERVITKKELADLISNIPPQGNTSQTIQSPRFTLKDIERMRNDIINNGIQYNFNGQPASPGEQVITLDWLNDLQLKLQTQGPMTPVKHTYTFTLDQIKDMINGIDKGLTYNYHGKPAQPGERVITKKELADLISNIPPQGNTSQIIQSPQFTLEDIERMKNGMINNGMQYNLNGQPASPGEPVIPLDWLNDSQLKLQTMGPTTPVKHTYTFTLDQIKDMINGIDKGLKYNYHGKPAQPGERVITKKELADLISNIPTQGNTSQTIQSPRFTLTDIERMRNDIINNGIQYNFNGQPASPGEQVITLDWLNDLQLKLQTQGPMTPVKHTYTFTLDQIKDMIKGIDKGLTYNYHGKPAQPGERVITKKELADLISNIPPQGNTSQIIQSPQFTLEDIERMKNGMINNGMQYNLNGQPASSGEPVIPLDWLNDSQLKLQTMGPTTPVKHTYTFTLDQIKDMINGIDKGLIYNYHGKPAQPGERVITKKELADLISNTPPQGNTSQTIQSPQFTLKDIERMRNDIINNGIQYNFNGQPALPGEQVITLDWLNDLQLKFETMGPMTPVQHTYTFTLDQINEMIDGIDKGFKYNYRGKPAQPGERIITKQELVDLISNIPTLGNATNTIQSTPYSLVDINRMKDDISRGIKHYNGDQLITINWLNDLQRQLLAQADGTLQPSSFSIDDVRRMMRDMESGHGLTLPGAAGDPKLSMTDLEGLLKKLETAATVVGTGAGDTTVDLNPVVGGTGPDPQTGTGPDPLTGTGPNPSTGTVPDPQTGTGPDPSTETGPDLSTGTGPDISTGTGPDPPTGPDPSTGAGTGSDPSTGPGPNPSTGTGPDSSTGGGTGHDPSTGPGPEPSTGTGTGPDSSTGDGSRPDPSTGPGPDPSTGSGLDISTGTGPDPPTGPDPSTGAGTGPEPSTGTGTGTGPDSSTGDGSRPDPSTGPGPDPSTGSGLDSAAGGGTGPDPLAGPGPDPSTGTGSDSSTGAGTRPDPSMGAGPDSSTGARTGPESSADAGTGPDPSTGAGPDQSTGTKPDPSIGTGATETGSDTSTGTGTGQQPGPQSGETAATTSETVEIFIGDGPEPTKLFNRKQITDMITGTALGKSYNFMGDETNQPESGFQDFQLRDFLETMNRQKDTGSLVPPDMFTRDDVIRMISGSEQGQRFNLQGHNAFPGDLILSMKYLIWLLSTMPERPNLALNSRTQLSSSSNTIWKGDNAVDGVTIPDMSQNSCFMTNTERNPYIIIDLQGVYGLDSLVIYNTDFNQGNLAKDIEISTAVARDQFRPYEIITGPLLMETNVPFTPTGRPAQYIKIASSDLNPVALALCEIMIYGDFIRENLCGMSPCLNGGTCTNRPGVDLCICDKGWEGTNCEISNENIALGKPTTLSSIFQNDLKYGGRKGVDGNTNSDMSAGSCFRTKEEMNPWVRLDLGAVYELQRLKLTNRGDCCSNDAQDAEIHIGLTADNMKPIYSNPGPIGPVLDVSNIPPGTQGQFVVIRLNGLVPSILQLCEIEIYGKYIRADQCSGGNPCENGGTCTNRLGMSNCICQDGFIGATCAFEAAKYTGPDVPSVGETWRKAIIDPSVCRNCNLPKCYLPYDKDCKSYVVCVRTASRTFVATKMRCAFGTFWGLIRNMWTCERLEDLLTQGFTCPTDPCSMDRTLETYADEEVSNCRTFWRCDKGLSRPMCCPPGQMFNRQRLICEDDHQESCRSHCPLKIEGCSQANARNATFYDGNCRTYWDCASGHPHPVCCPLQMSYDSGLGSCVNDAQCNMRCPSHYSYDLQRCAKEAGSNDVTKYWLDDGNCRTYMKCSPNGDYDTRYCCPKEFYFDDRTKKCEVVTNATDRCNFETCPPKYHDDCRFKPVEGNPKQFYDTKANLVSDCAPGAEFAPELCTCAGNNLINEYKVCKPEVFIRFDKKGKWSVKNYGDGTVSPYGDLVKNRTRENITYGEYDGSSGVQVWRYDHKAFPNFNMEITFQPVAAKQNVQILASNCMTVDNGSPSFEVSLNPRTSEIMFFGKSKYNSTEFTLPYDKADWNTLKIMYDGKHVAGEIEYGLGTGSSQPFGTIQPLKGDIVAGSGAFKVGPCVDGTPLNNGFTGLVSEIKFAPCITSINRKFIQDMEMALKTAP